MFELLPNFQANCRYHGDGLMTCALDFIDFYLKEKNCTGKGGRPFTQRIIAQRERYKQTKSDFV